MRAVAAVLLIVYHVINTVPIGGAGRWDYVTFDPASKLLFVPRSTHTQVIDPAAGKVVADIPDTQGVHGVALVPELNRGFTSNGREGTVTIFDLTTFKTLGKISAADDCDCIIYDPASKHVLTFCGDAREMIPIPANIDPVNGKADAPVDLGGSPEFAVSDFAGKVFSNINSTDEVAVIDTPTMKILNRWPLGKGHRPTGMSMDRKSRRLFIGCRNQVLVVMNADTGAIVATFPIGKGVDATAFDPPYALASCSDGTLTVVKENSPDDFALVQVLKTAPGARTMAASNGTIYLPTADLGPAPAPTADRPHPYPSIIPNTFKIVVVQRISTLPKP